ncbi:MAG: hypothetical protein MZV70_20085, partial [Desulfobacterales bacterium]|nr:hypothetical protein [Desulfobacterales bacterium]
AVRLRIAKVKQTTTNGIDSTWFMARMNPSSARAGLGRLERRGRWDVCATPSTWPGNRFFSGRPPSGGQGPAQREIHRRRGRPPVGPGLRDGLGSGFQPGRRPASAADHRGGTYFRRVVPVADITG